MGTAFCDENCQALPNESVGEYFLSTFFLDVAFNTLNVRSNL